MSVARKVKTDVAAVSPEKPKDNASFSFYDEDFPLKGCAVGETVTITVKGKVTSVHSDEYSSGIRLDVSKVEKYK